MTPGAISKRIVLDRLAGVESMLGEIRALPLDSRELFLSDRRNVWAAESCLRRALEGMLDIGRHLLAKGFGTGVSEYKEIAEQLREKGILEPEYAVLLRQMAGYRNRLVHFYHEVSREELYSICTEYLGDVDAILSALKKWLQTHPEKLDERL